jgi:hypothetical protein
MSRTSVFVCVAMAALPLCAQAADRLSGLMFSHEDWELVCDNTRTCRAAGYQSDQDGGMTLSVLFARKAGPSEPVTGELMIGSYDNDELLNQLPSTIRLSMRINGRGLGQVAVRQDGLVAKLSAKDVAALLAALTRKSNIEWVAGEHRWRLSDKGAAAVLLKMDEFQGRIGTRGALVRKGPQGEEAVLPPLPVPVVIAGPLAKPRPGDNQLATGKSKALHQAFLATLKDDDCPSLLEDEADARELSFARLTDSKLLVSTLCWRGAYNSGDGYWVINDKPPYHPILVTTSGSDYSDGSISASHKGRGLGDCWSSDSWTWDGEQFVHTQSSSTGMCKLVASGGAWSLPVIVMEVRHPPH